MKIGFSAIVKDNHNHVILLDTPLHADDKRDESKLPWHKYLKEQKFKNSHHYHPPTLLSPALDNMKVVTELIAGLCNVVCVHLLFTIYSLNQRF